MKEKETIVRIQTPYGTLCIDKEADKKMAGALECGEYPNEGLLNVARMFVDKKSAVLDIGAHIGSFAIPIAAEAGTVIAVEPAPAAFALLSRNAEENNAPLQILHKALGSGAGKASIVVRNASNAGANTLIPGGTIPVVTLDSEVAHADFIKMDVEGMELDVLRGGIQLIESARPVVIFEVNLSQLRAHGASPRALERFFISRGYHLYIPLGEKNPVLACVKNTTLLTACIAPRALFFFGESAPFDLVAVPKERATTFQSSSFMHALLHALRENLSIKVRRLGKSLVDKRDGIYVHGN